jgi:hypothetical protein
VYNPRESPFSQIIRVWWPLAGSWLLMGLELPLVSLILARFPHPEIQLAAFGGIVFPLALIIEAPVIMILSASTALCRDWSAYRLIRNFIWILGGILTAVHFMVAFTPLYELIVIEVLHAPAPIVGPAQAGLQIMTPWTVAIAARRFLQGIVIRSGHTRLIVFGTLARMCVSACLLVSGLLWSGWPGITVATMAMVSGVLVEAGVIRVFVQPTLRALRNGPPDTELSISRLISFYVPLAATPLITLATLPIISGALSRMPQALPSLAVWPVLGGLTFVFRSVGFALQEVVIAFGQRPDFIRPLRRFAGGLACCTTGILLIIALTPLSTVWFESVAALNPELARLARNGLWVALLLPLFSPWESFFNGMLVQRGQTKRVTQAVGLYAIGSVFILGLGIFHGGLTGLYVGLTAVVFGLILQTLWLIRNSDSLGSG